MKNNSISLVQYFYGCLFQELELFNPLPHMPTLGSSNSAANKNIMSKIWTNGVQLSDVVENFVGKREIAHYNVFKSCLLLMHQNEYLRSKGLIAGSHLPNSELKC